jgi:LPS-assembly protein
MAATYRHLKTLAQHMLNTTIALAPALAIAAPPSYPQKQWVCQPVDNSWQCQQSTAPGSYPQPLTLPSQPKVGQNQVPGSKQQGDFSQWDFLPRQQLTDPSTCPTGCSGAYQAPAADWEGADKNPDQAPLRADAASSSMVGDAVSLRGEVLISQGNRSVKADNAEFNRETNQLTLTGNIEAREPSLLLRADQAQVNTDSNLGRFDNALFVIHDSSMRGTAKVLQRNSTDTIDLKGGSVTQCTPDDVAWTINAASIHLDTAEGMGVAKHARLNIKNIPLLYVPYFSFPIDDRRKTGLLAPSFGSSNDNGFELTVPYYLNIAPSFDATLAPHFIEKRGTMLEAELRHLNRWGSWLIAGSDLNDDQYTDTPSPSQANEVPPQEHRWIGSLNHQGKLFGLSTRIDYSKVSDEDFFDDLATDSLELKRTTHLNQQATLGYNVANWQVELTAQDHQTVDELLNKQYQLMPRFSVERNFIGTSFALDWQLAAEFTDFQHDQSIADGGNFVTGERNFGEFGLSYPMRWAAGFITPTAKLRSISYQLDDTAAGVDDSPSASAPLASLDMGLIFERSFQFSDSNYLQTLEPRLYYLYSEYQQQDAATPNFDSRELQFSYSQLFRDSRFSGHDRLADADQLSVGVTSRFINDRSGHELLTLSVGQIFYFDDRKIQLDNNQNLLQSSSAIATEVLYQPREQLWLSNNLLWDSREDKLEEGGLGLHYQTDSNSLYNLSYRYRRLGTTSLTEGSRDLSQLDASMALAINDRWSLFSRYRYDTEDHRSLDQMVGVQYDDCCWMVRLLYQEGVKDQFIDELSNLPVVENDYAFLLEFQLKGLGSLGNKAERLLTESILGYEDLD